MLSEPKAHAFGQFMRRDFVLFDLVSAEKRDSARTGKYFREVGLEE